MGNRIFERVPTSIKVHFRKASSLLFAYSVNISRGGLFLATEKTFENGTPVELELEIPGIGATMVKGDVSWARHEDSEQGPKGIGIKFSYLDEKLSSFIDHLVSNFLEVKFLVFSADVSDGKNMARMLRSIIGSAQVDFCKNQKELAELQMESFDLILIDVDEDEDEAWQVIKALKNHPSKVPVLALASTDELKKESVSCGSLGVADNPPQFNNLRLAVIKTISEPSAVSPTSK